MEGGYAESFILRQNFYEGNMDRGGGGAMSFPVFPMSLFWVKPFFVFWMH